MKVLLGPREPLEKALRRFKRVCSDAGVFSEIKRNSYYEKPSDRKRRAKRKRLKNIAQAQSGKPRRPPRGARGGRHR